MPNVAKVLKDEIQRLARKEVKTSVGNLRKETVAVKRSLAALKRQMSQIERAIKELRKSAGKGSMAGSGSVVGEELGFRISAKGMRSLRAKMKLSQAEFGKLIGVSGQSVYQWERKEGPLTLRRTTKRRLMEVRRMGRREALKQLIGE